MFSIELRINDLEIVALWLGRKEEEKQSTGMDINRNVKKKGGRDKIIFPK